MGDSNVTFIVQNRSNQAKRVFLEDGDMIPVYAYLVCLYPGVLWYDHRYCSYPPMAPLYSPGASNMSIELITHCDVIGVKPLLAQVKTHMWGY